MTQQEKDEMNSKRMERLAKERKGKIILAIVLPVAGLVLSGIIGAAGASKNSEIASATVLDGITVGDFLDENPNGSAIYTGSANAADPVSVKGADGEYISIDVTVEQIRKELNKETDKYEEEITELSHRKDHCEQIELDDMIIVYDVFHRLPEENEVYKEGPESNEFKTTYKYIPRIVDGTFFIKCKDGDIDSIEYYESADVGKESSRTFGLALVIIWLIVIVVEIMTIVKIVSLGKALKSI